MVSKLATTYRSRASSPWTAMGPFGKLRVMGQSRFDGSKVLDGVGHDRSVDGRVVEGSLLVEVDEEQEVLDER
jgi:hypothetical protein